LTELFIFDIICKINENKMVFYNWNKFSEISKGDAKDIVLLFTILALKLKVPNSAKSRKRHFYTQNLIGDSFIINEKDLLKSNTSLRNIAQYIALASYRNYLDYRWYGNLTLPLKYSKIDRDIIDKNPLLIIDEKNNIHFKYEEKLDGN